MAVSGRVGLAAALAAAFASNAVAATQNQWVQYGPNDTVLLRSISVADAACPAASIDGVPVTMTQRFTPADDAQATGGAFTTGANAVEMCEASMPIDYAQKSATIDGRVIAMPKGNPARILVVGDTGCRLNGAANQGCNDPLQFPLPFLANYAATFKPDLIVHVGDFYYREKPCPAGDNACVGSPSGDNWQSWNADWFTPAQALISTAPLAISRGNHESCGRGAKGWFSLLDPSPYSAAKVACTGPTDRSGPLTSNDTTGAYFVRAGNANLMMFDGSIADDISMTTATAASVISIYQKQITAALATLPVDANVVYVAHRPAYAILFGTHATTYSGGNATEQGLFEALGGVPAQIKLLLSGHDHQFQNVTLSNTAKYAPQMVVGDSGTLLDNNQVAAPGFGVAQVYTPDLVGSGAGGSYTLAGGTAPVSTIATTADRAQFGFAVLDATATGYVANVYTLGATKAARCVVTFTPVRDMACVD